MGALGFNCLLASRFFEPGFGFGFGFVFCAFILFISALKYTATGVFGLGWFEYGRIVLSGANVNWICFLLQLEIIL